LPLIHSRVSSSVFAWPSNHSDRGANLIGVAVAALKNVFVNKRLLQGM
jgi:hypothetical protein